MGAKDKLNGLEAQNIDKSEIGLLTQAINLLPNPVYIKDRNHQWVFGRKIILFLQQNRKI